MAKEEIEPFDWKRILFGDTPVEFMIEVFFRTLIIYLALLIVLRLMGKRMDGQLGIAEFAVMLTFGAIVSAPMQMPDRGLLVGMVAMLCMLIFERGVNWLAVKNKKVQEAIQGTPSILIKDGILQLDEMQRTRLSKQNIFAALRTKQILNLGNVKRLYFEACGLINVYQQESPTPGLAILPADEMKFTRERMQRVEGKIACENCGNVNGSEKRESTCGRCGAQRWTDATY